MTETVLIHHQKFYITHTKDKNREAVVELKIWRVNDSRYPNGIKYSLFCVDLETHEVVVGLDNHHPKGHHLHIMKDEFHYFYKDQKNLIEDFFVQLKKHGFQL